MTDLLKRQRLRPAMVESLREGATEAEFLDSPQSRRSTRTDAIDGHRAEGASECSSRVGREIE